jgi:hypothetical protein
MLGRLAAAELHRFMESGEYEQRRKREAGSVSYVSEGLQLGLSDGRRS